MRKILLDKVREDFSHTHPEFNTLQSKPVTYQNGHSPNTNDIQTTSAASTSINTVVNPFTLPSQLRVQQHSPPMNHTQSSIHVIPYNNLQNSVPVLTNQSIVFPPPLLSNNPTAANTNTTTPSLHYHNDTVTNQVHPTVNESSNNRLNTSSVSSTNSSTTTSSGDEEMEIVSEEKKKKSTRRTSNTRRRSHSNQSNHSNEQDQSNSTHQTMCCIQNCTKDVSNRLRFSLRCETEFKPEYVAKFWNNICNYCYFHDLYQWKKLNQQSDSTTSSVSTGKRKNSSTSNSSGTRKRANSSLSTNSTTSNRSTKSAKSDLSDKISNHNEDRLSPPPISHSHQPSATLVTNNSTSQPSANAASFKKVEVATKKPLKIDTSFTLSTSLHKPNLTNPPPVVNNYVDPSPVHKEDVNALLDFLSAASQNN